MTYVHSLPCTNKYDVCMVITYSKGMRTIISTCGTWYHVGIEYVHRIAGRPGSSEVPCNL